jgi:pimeloyl-ACP methyl ester carboxylesterase
MERTPLTSTSLRSVGYDSGQQVLEIEFQDDLIYRYSEVPQEVYDHLVAADSHGQYFNANIRNAYPYLRINHVLTDKKYVEELRFSVTEDQLAHEGIAIHPVATARSTIGILCIHGNTSRFSDFPYIIMGRALAERGYLFVSGNTRGHDVAASIWSDAHMQHIAGGSAWERLEDAPQDVAAWIDDMVSLGVERVVLVGHSQGAAKVTYYQALRQDARTAGIVLASPDLHGHWRGVLDEARRLVEQNREDEVLPDFINAPWYRLSAKNILSRAAVLDHIYTSVDGPPTIASVRVPILALFGDAGDVGGQAELETIKTQATAFSQVQTAIIPGADHGYTNTEGAVAKVIADWISTL